MFTPVVQVPLRSAFPPSTKPSPLPCPERALRHAPAPFFANWVLLDGLSDSFDSPLSAGRAFYLMGRFWIFRPLQGAFSVPLPGSTLLLTAVNSPLRDSSWYGRMKKYYYPSVSVPFLSVCLRLLFCACVLKTDIFFAVGIRQIHFPFHSLEDV